MQPIDELFERDFALIYTTDPNMATHKGEDKMPVQVIYHLSPLWCVVGDILYLYGYILICEYYV